MFLLNDEDIAFSAAFVGEVTPQPIGTPRVGEVLECGVIRDEPYYYRESTMSHPVRPWWIPLVNIYKNSLPETTTRRMDLARLDQAPFGTQSMQGIPKKGRAAILC